MRHSNTAILPKTFGTDFGYGLSVPASIFLVLSSTRTSSSDVRLELH